MEKNVSKEQMSKLPYIIAVDFDGTLVEDKFPEIGRPIEKNWELLRKAQQGGAKIILWTSRDHDRLDDAVKFCNERENCTLMQSMRILLNAKLFSTMILERCMRMNTGMTRLHQDFVKFTHS